MAIADVPDSPLSTVGRLGLIPLAEPLTAQFTLTLLLLHHLKGNGGEFRIAGVDAVLIELDFFHVPMIAENGTKVNRVGTVPRLSHAVEHLRDRLLIFFIGGEAVPITGGNLTDGSVDRIATLLDHLQAVGVLCFVHGPNIAQNRANCNRSCATPSTGQAAAQFVSISGKITADCIT